MSVPPIPFSFSHIKAEFGGLLSTPFSAYLRGGSLVPIQTLGNIPTALPMSMSAFAGAVFPASLTYDHATVTAGSGYVVSTQVVAPDLSTATIVLTRTKVFNGGSSMFDVNELDLLFNIAGAINPSVVIRLPATQPRDGNGYWKQISASDVKKINTPAQFTPAEDYIAFDHAWRITDTLSQYQGDFHVNTLIPFDNGPTPPSTPNGMIGAQAAVRFTISWSMNIGTAVPPGVQMTWNTRNVSNTFVEFPIIIDVYDGAILRASYPMLCHIEFNCLTTFNPS